MKKKRHKPEEIVRKLREAEALQGSGKSIEAASRELGVGLATLHRWRAENGGATADVVKQVKELKTEPPEGSATSHILASAFYSSSEISTFLCHENSHTNPGMAKCSGSVLNGSTASVGISTTP